MAFEEFALKAGAPDAPRSRAKATDGETAHRTWHAQERPDRSAHAGISDSGAGCAMDRVRDRRCLQPRRLPGGRRSGGAEVVWSGVYRGWRGASGMFADLAPRRTDRRPFRQRQGVTTKPRRLKPIRSLIPPIGMR